MKLLYCEQCGDIISPNRGNFKPRWCECKRHAVWWVDGSRGILRVHDIEGPTDQGPSHYNQRAWVLGVHNQFLQWEGGYGTSRDMIDTILDATPDTYLFKQVGSVIVRIRPGKSNDTGWSPLPDVGTPK